MSRNTSLYRNLWFACGCTRAQCCPGLLMVMVMVMVMVVVMVMVMVVVMVMVMGMVMVMVTVMVMTRGCVLRVTLCCAAL